MKLPALYGMLGVIKHTAQDTVKMIYIFGTLGFFGGFILGQAVLAQLLRHKSRDDLLTDKRLRWKYGALNWLIAFATAASAVYIYQSFFL